MRLLPCTGIIGGEVEDLDLSQALSAADFAQFKDLFYERSVVVVRNQTLDGEALLRFARARFR